MTLEKNIPEHVKEFFYTGQEQRSPETERGEGRLYDTTLSLFIQNMQERIEFISPDKWESMEKLTASIDKAARGYVYSRVEHIRQAKKLRSGGNMSGMTQVVEELDKSRRNAHNALIDIITAVARNIIGATLDDAGPLDDALVVLVDKPSPHFRDNVAGAAIDYIWQQLDALEWQHIHGQSK
ncbi:MAG: hypothetical protein Q8P30_04300 [Candidatus Uhrbacteria bacterium]|nr:hypothetical protein [Candidatus Uhrbacteria bacterium]